MSKTVAFIPVRGGSKSIPLKNIKDRYGKPLVYWVAKAACNATLIDEVYVSTDNSDIRKAIYDFCEKEKDQFSKLVVITRSAENASDTASTESAMLEFAQNHDFENIVLVQATSPLLQGEDLDGGVTLFNEPSTDSVLSVVLQKRFVWKANNEGVQPVNYDIFQRPRRQEFDGFLMENGAFYITSRAELLRTKNRISGCIKAYIMPDDTALEIDEPTDFAIIEQLIKKRINEKERLGKRKIKMMVTDCDGCLTDGGMYYSERGDELKKFNTKDGAAISSLKNEGVIVGVITGENRELNKRRAEKLHLDFIKQGIADKRSALISICDEYKVTLDEDLYIRDDFNDLDTIKNVGYSACPADASACIVSCVDYVAKRNGGCGAVRDIIEHFFGI